MIVALYIAAAAIMAAGSLYLADVSVPLLGTGFVETPNISGGRSIVHFILFLVCLYFGFVRKPRANTPRFMSVGDR